MFTHPEPSLILSWWVCRALMGVICYVLCVMHYILDGNQGNSPRFISRHLIFGNFVQPIQPTYFCVVDFDTILFLVTPHGRSLHRSLARPLQLWTSGHGRRLADQDGKINRGTKRIPQRMHFSFVGKWREPHIHSGEKKTCATLFFPPKDWLGPRVMKFQV